MKKKLTVGLSTFLCLILLFAALPMTAFADNSFVFYYMNEDENNYPVPNEPDFKWKVGDKTDVIYDQIYMMFNDPGWAKDINSCLEYPEDTDLNSAELTIYANSKLLQRGIDCVEFLGGENVFVEVYVIVKLPCTHPSDKITHHNPKDANCTEDGNEEYWECTKCGKLFSDADCKNETSSANVTITKLGHHVKDGSSVAKVPADGCLNGCRAYYECDRCNNYIDSDNKVIGDADALATWKITKNKGLIAGNPDSHRSTAVTTVTGKDATCEEDGIKGCVVCQNCGKYAEKVNGTGDYVTLKDIIGDETAFSAWKTGAGKLDKLGHDYPDTWEQETGNDTQHKRVCKNDTKHIEYQDHTFGDPVLKTRADDGAEGEYTCECTVCGYVKSEKFSYKVTKGEGSTYTLGSKKDLAITANGEFSKFEKLQIDGADLAADKYTAVSGSTIVTLKNAYLETLKAGKHTIKYIYSDGSCTGSFVVAKKSGGGTGGSGKPQTGDNGHIVLWISLTVLSAAAFALALVWFRKRELLLAAVSADEKALPADDQTTEE